MAIDISDREAWKTWHDSGDPEKMKFADELFPLEGIREEKNIILREGRFGFDKGIHLGKVMRKYLGPKDEFRNMKDAYKALIEIRHYSKNN